MKLRAFGWASATAGAVTLTWDEHPVGATSLVLRRSAASNMGAPSTVHTWDLTSVADPLGYAESRTNGRYYYQLDALVGAVHVYSNIVSARVQTAPAEGTPTDALTNSQIHR